MTFNEKNEITFNEYQEQTKTFRLSTYNEGACLFGLLAEAGEVATVMQKSIRDGWSSEKTEELMFKELGDILWHLSEIANDNGWKLSDIAAGNIAKLTSRQARNVISGSGDSR